MKKLNDNIYPLVEFIGNTEKSDNEHKKNGELKEDGHKA